MRHLSIKRDDSSVFPRLSVLIMSLVMSNVLFIGAAVVFVLVSSSYAQQFSLSSIYNTTDCSNPPKFILGFSSGLLGGGRDTACSSLTGSTSEFQKSSAAAGADAISTAFGSTPYVYSQAFSDSNCQTSLGVEAIIVDGSCISLPGNLTSAIQITLQGGNKLTSQMFSDTKCSTAQSSDTPFFPSWFTGFGKCVQNPTRTSGGVASVMLTVFSGGKEVTGSSLTFANIGQHNDSGSKSQAMLVGATRPDSSLLVILSLILVAITTFS